MTLDIYSGPYDQNQDFPHIPGFCENRDKSGGPEPCGSAKSPGYEEKLSRQEPRESGDPRVTTLSVEDAKWFRISRFRQAALKTVARDWRDDPNFDWRKWAYYVANEMRQFPPGLYIGPGWRREERWTGASFLSILYRGKNPVFNDDEDVPPYIARATHDGMRDAPADEDYVPKTKQDFAKGLGITASDRERLKVWLIGAKDRTPAQLRAEAKERRKQRSRDAWRAAHPNSTARENSVAAQARQLGIKPATLQARLRRWRLAREALARMESLAAVKKSKPPTVKESQPWIAEGVGRSTYFARKAQAKAAANGQGAVGLANSQAGLEVVAFSSPANKGDSFPEASRHRPGKKTRQSESSAPNRLGGVAFGSPPPYVRAAPNALAFAAIYQAWSPSPLAGVESTRLAPIPAPSPSRALRQTESGVSSAAYGVAAMGGSGRRIGQGRRASQKRRPPVVGWRSTTPGRRLQRWFARETRRGAIIPALASGLALGARRRRSPASVQSVALFRQFVSIGRSQRRANSGHARESALKPALAIIAFMRRGKLRLATFALLSEA